jgi:hypothetical protein
MSQPSSQRSSTLLFLLVFNLEVICDHIYQQ